MTAAARFVGIRETGQNRGEPYRLFMKPYGYGPGTAWCGLFAHHVFVTAGVKHGVKGPSLARNWAIPASSLIWKFGAAVRNKPPPMSGDLALFCFSGSRYINHVEIIVNWPPGENYCWVIGGNTANPANRNQEGVFAKQRLKRDMIVSTHIVALPL